MRPCRKTVTSAPTRKPAPIRKSASRSGWRGDDVKWIVMAGRSRLKDGVASACLCLAIRVFGATRKERKTWMPGLNNKPGHDEEGRPLKQTSLTDRLGNALRRRRLWLACNGFRRTGCHRPIRVRGGADASVGKFQVEPRTRADAGRGVDGEAVLIAHQRKAAGQHAAI